MTGLCVFLLFFFGGGGGGILPPPLQSGLRDRFHIDWLNSVYEVYDSDG